MCAHECVSERGGRFLGKALSRNTQAWVADWETTTERKLIYTVSAVELHVVCVVRSSPGSMCVLMLCSKEEHNIRTGATI